MSANKTIESGLPPEAAELQKEARILEAAHAAKVLAGCGAIGNDKVDEFVNKVAEDPSGVWDFVEKMAEMISAPTLGSASESFPSRSVDDPWSKLIFGESHGSKGYVD